MIAREITDAAYGVKVYLLAKCSAKEANSKIKKLFNLEAGLDQRAYGSLIQYKDGKQFIMWLRRVDNDTIMHECVHLLDDIYAYRSIAHDPACPACSEHRAYQLTGWVNIIKQNLK